MRKLAVLLLPVTLAGCGLLFGSDFTIDFTVQVQSVSDSGGTVTCDVLISATAVGDDGDRGQWGESQITLRRVSDGSVAFSESLSAAFMAAQFISDDIAAGETQTSQLLSRSADGPFVWEFSFNYRKPDSFRETAEAEVTCQP